MEDGRSFGFELVVEAAKGLPEEYSWKTFCRYKLFGQVCESEILKGPDAGYKMKKTFKFKMNSEIRKKLKHGVLVVDVYGQSEPDTHFKLKSKLERTASVSEGDMSA